MQPIDASAASWCRRRFIVPAAVAVIALLAFAACGGSSSSTDSSSDPRGSGDDPGVASATKALKPFLKAPTKINVTTPLRNPAPTGKSLVNLGTSQAQNVQLQQTAAEVTKALGWDFKVVNYDPANISTFQAALQTAIARRPDFIGWAGLPISLVSPKTMKQIESAGIKLVAQASHPEVLNDTVLANPAGYSNTVEMGKAVGYFFVSNSGGEGNALIHHVPAYSVLDGFVSGFKSVVSEMCPKCKTQELDVTLPDLAAGKGNSLVVSALRRNPSVDYLVYDNAAFANGIPQALSAAGLSDQVKIIGQLTDPAALSGLRDGTETAWMGYSPRYSQLQSIDAMIRSAEGMPANPQDNVQPTQLLTSENVGSITDWNEPSDMVEQFMSLWKQ